MREEKNSVAGIVLLVAYLPRYLPGLSKQTALGLILMEVLLVHISCYVESFLFLFLSFL